MIGKGDEMKNGYWLTGFGLLLILIFGGGFLIRLMRDGDFYVAEFIGGLAGVIILLIGTFLKKNHHRQKADFGK